jgi:hypothetical protein
MSNNQTEEVGMTEQNSKDVFKILSLDGGGIKGIYSSRIIEQFEQKFSCNIADYFDLLCGTSTGGLIALALSAKILAKEITDFYYQKGPIIFPKKTKRGLLVPCIGRSKYSNKDLENELKKIFGSRKIYQSNCLLCIPSFSITDGRPYIFKYDHLEGKLSRDNQTNYVDIALATSAAPTYLPIVQIPDQENKQFVDGGVYANNPTLIGVIEALRYFVGANKKFKKLMVMSIASIEHPGGMRLNIKKDRSIFDWGQDLIDPFFEGQAYVTDYITTNLAEHTDVQFKYLRIPSPRLSKEQMEILTFDNTNQEALDLMKGKGRDEGLIYEKDPRVAEFFNFKKNYIIQR